MEEPEQPVLKTWDQMTRRERARSRYNVRTDDCPECKNETIPKNYPDCITQYQYAYIFSLIDSKLDKQAAEQYNQLIEKDNSLLVKDQELLEKTQELFQTEQRVSIKQDNINRLEMALHEQEHLSLIPFGVFYLIVICIVLFVSAWMFWFVKRRTNVRKSSKHQDRHFPVKTPDKGPDYSGTMQINDPNFIKRITVVQDPQSKINKNSRKSWRTAKKPEVCYMQEKLGK